MKPNKAIVSLATFILVTIVNCQNPQDLLITNQEETDYELLCYDSNITVSFGSIRLFSIEDNFISSPLITCLNLGYNEINSIANNAFYQLPNLKYLNLAGNSISLNQFFKNSFFNLETLVLNNNRYSRSKIEITGTFPNLRKLFLKSNEISGIAAISKSNFPILTHLFLTGNRIDDNEFSWLPESLQYLDLSGHNLQSLTLRDLRHLKWLILNKDVCQYNCYDNEYKLIEVHFENLQSLLSLSILHNEIQTITSATFKNVSALKYLDLSDNSISNIEADAFQSMHDLEILNISNNNIEVLHIGTLDKLKNLKTLNLEKNILSSIPMIFEKLNIEVLSLNCNTIKKIQLKEFVALPSLKTLYLQDNEIIQIHEEAFAGLEELKTLILSNNKLSVLPSNWLLPMISLEVVDLTGNQFIKFGHLGLSESSPVQHLFLTNQLHYIEPQSMYTMPENVTVYLNETFTSFETCVKTQSKYGHQNYYG